VLKETEKEEENGSKEIHCKEWNFKWF